ncbi:phenylacetate-CoA oxygenase PaaJ subunit [Bradyrhizobium huanghuaihaiense]
MVTVLDHDSELRRRAWDAAASVVDPEIPVLSIADLGVLRDVVLDGEHVEVAITPTYSGCPAMNMIALEIEIALERAGFRQPKVRTVLSPAWTTDWMSEEGREKLRAYGIAPPPGLGLAPRAIRRAGRRLPAMRLGQDRAAVRIRLDLLQSAVALPDLSRTF